MIGLSIPCRKAILLSWVLALLILSGRWSSLWVAVLFIEKSKASGSYPLASRSTISVASFDKTTFLIPANVLVSSEM